jgi:capsid protein
VNLDVPLTDLLYDGSRTNFSGERAVTQKARERYSELQTWLIDELYRPVFEWLVRRWVREDATLAAAMDEADVDVFAHSWNRPVWPYIDPLKDATADNVQLSNGHESPVRYHAKRHGRDWDEFYVETVNAYGEAIEFAMARADLINERFPTHPTPVSWQHLLPLPTPNGIVVNATSVDSTPNAPNQPQQ